MMMSQLASVLDGKLHGSDVEFDGVSKDTRDIRPGSLYVALVGERFDGHDFIAQAMTAGAAGALVSHVCQHELPQVEVDDTRIGLGRLAAWWRNQFQGKVIGITGSNGKTSVKEMCKHILGSYAGNGSVLATRGNLNNDIGMPMMLLELGQQYEYAVIEMGANHVGEIGYLTHIARPHVALVNNVGPAHLEGFGSLDNIATAKGEIYDGLVEGGVAVVNIDDCYGDQWFQACSANAQIGSVFTFSMKDANANLYAEKAGHGHYRLHCAGDTSELMMNVPGEHNVMNSLAAISATINVGVPLQKAVECLTGFENIGGRLTEKQSSLGFRVIDDTYNANPLSVRAAIDVLAEFTGPKVLVLGDMAELGDDRNRLHREIGEYTRDRGIDQLFVAGDLVQYTAEGFGENANYFTGKADLINALMNVLTGDEVVLVKGSRSAAMEEVVERILTHDKNTERVN
jgi:UDP-N-acetylmuramoyl-tripeptide--D-alanyl-D-alanine ligase